MLRIIAKVIPEFRPYHEKVIQYIQLVIIHLVFLLIVSANILYRISGFAKLFLLEFDSLQ